MVRQTFKTKLPSVPVVAVSCLALCLSAFSIEAVAWGQDWFEKLEHKFAENEGVKLHYVKSGRGPLIVFIHGFPDFWYSWRHQIRGLAEDFTVVAMDTRGYNLSGQPEEESQYEMSHLVSDVVAVINNEGSMKAIVAGHDWGGAIAWSTAVSHPDKVEQLVIVNLPHPACLTRELMSKDSQQHRNSVYARTFQTPGSHLALNPTLLTSFLGLKSSEDRERYLEAFKKSSIQGMMNYYKRNYPREPYQMPSLPKVQMPVLQFHGLGDNALLAPALNNTWDQLAKDWTLVTLPGVGHWAHHEAPEKVTETMRWWLRMQRESKSISEAAK